MKLAVRMGSLQTSIFSQLASLKEELKREGKALIDLSVGSPDLPPSLEIRKIISEQSLDERAYGYTLTRGIPEFREACSLWYKRRFNVDIDPATEVLPVMGSQDGLTHIFWAFIDKGDAAFIPDPGYPIYSDGLALVEGEKVVLPLLETNDFLPDLNRIPSQTADRAKLMVLNYPNNPTAAVASETFFNEVVRFASKHEIVVCHDAAYTELAFDGYRPSSFLQAKGAKDVGVEFHSLSKSYNMAGVRLGFVVGNKEVIRALETIKSNIDYGSFQPVLKAGVAVLSGGDQTILANQQTYKNRRDIWVDGCARAGWKMNRPKGSMFVWAPVPTKQDSLSFAFELASEAGVLVVPGIAFGRYGEGYVRVGLVQDETKLQEAVQRVGTFLAGKD
ncbi:aminotransferase class I/II-fold pyridoxal phosphate-dependent enzyme [Dehalobacter sp. TBBPA1]|uniref:aminotransferase class I/II-fold pyridoxal phosphate-dependent enzyme n=1 Tax=Dehalobacter sp. TBBPA1 TaxID=3235037 RepID=UPI0034A5BAC9